MYASLEVKCATARQGSANAAYACWMMRSKPRELLSRRLSAAPSAELRVNASMRSSRPVNCNELQQESNMEVRAQDVKAAMQTGVVRHVVTSISGHLATPGSSAVFVRV